MDHQKINNNNDYKVSFVASNNMGWSSTWWRP